MKHKLISRIVCAVVILTCGSFVALGNVEQIFHKDAAHKDIAMTKELIVLATPPNGDDYYADVLDEIFTFHISFVKQARAHDTIIVLTGSDYYDKYVEALGSKHVVRIEMQDIWMRDFSSSNAAHPVMFKYTAEGQGGGRKGQKEADFVQERLADFIEDAGMNLDIADWLNDGGNFVDDYAGNVVLSRKFLRDNSLTEEQGREAIQQSTGVKNVAFIEADEQGGLEHADGVVAFIKENTLVINSYPKDPEYSLKLKSDLKRGLPGVTLHEIITPYDGRVIYDRRFGSACGLYTNMLVTPERIYFPQFGIAEDSEALEQVRSWTDRDVIPVSSSQVCHMGGGVRCMSWQLRGEPAQTLLRHIRNRTDSSSH